MNQKAKKYIESNTLNLESNNRMDSTGYVRYAVSVAKAYGAIKIAEEEMIQKAILIFAQIYDMRTEYSKKEAVDMFERILTKELNDYEDNKI